MRGFLDTLTLERVAAWVHRFFFPRSVYVAERTGIAQANLPVKTNESGYIDSTLLNTTSLGTFFLPVTGDTQQSSANTDRFQTDIGDIAGTQKLEIDVTCPNGARRFVTHFDVSLSRNGTTTVYCLAHATALWQTNSGGGTATVHSVDIQYAMSGTPTAGGIAAITDGIRLTLDSSDFGNTLNDNMAVVTSVGHHAEDLVYTVRIT